MKKYILILVSILCILSSVGCGEGKETMDIQGILVDGVFYEKSYQPMPAEVDESAIIGYVESYTDSIPKKHGESNISKDIIGAPYAKVEGGIAILYENEWYLCKAETSEGTPDEITVEKTNQDFFNAVVLEVNGDEIIAECTECESGWMFEGCEVTFDTNTLSTEEVPNLEVGDLIRVVYVGGTNEKESVHLDQVVSIFWIDDNGKIVTAPAKKNVQKVETPDFGITLTVKNVTSKGLTLVCEQSGGESIGELFSGSSYSLSRYVEGNWETIEYLPKDTEVAWTDEAWIIPLEDTVEWDVNWEWLYGELAAGKYRMSKPVMNLSEPGDFNTAVHFVEFDVAE